MFPTSSATLTLKLHQDKFASIPRFTGPSKTTMLCQHCGSENPTDLRMCVRCGVELLATADLKPDTSSWLQIDTSEWLPKEDLPTPTSSAALAALALGLLSIFPPAGIAAVILGHASLIGIKQSDGRVRGANVAKLGLLCGYTGLLLFSIAFFGAAHYLGVPLSSLLPGSSQGPTLAVASTLHDQNTDKPATVQEINGMGALLQLSVAQTVHYHTNPSVGYACALNQLITTGFTDEMLISAAEDGYTLSIRNCQPMSDGRVANYLAVALPRDGAKVRGFCTDKTTNIRFVRDGDIENCATTGIPTR